MWLAVNMRLNCVLFADTDIGTPILMLSLTFSHVMALIAVIAISWACLQSLWLFFAQAEHVVGLYYGKR